MKIDLLTAINIAKDLGINTHIPPDYFDLYEFRKGLEEEQEHIDVTGDDPVAWGKIALAHLREDKTYYTNLELMKEGKTPVVCSYCKRTFKYISGVPEEYKGKVSHGICPECEPIAKKEVEDWKKERTKMNPTRKWSDLSKKEQKALIQQELDNYYADEYWSGYPKPKHSDVLRVARQRYETEAEPNPSFHGELKAPVRHIVEGRSCCLCGQPLETKDVSEMEKRGIIQDICHICAEEKLGPLPQRVIHRIESMSPLAKARFEEMTKDIVKYRGRRSEAPKERLASPKKQEIEEYGDYVIESKATDVVPVSFVEFKRSRQKAFESAMTNPCRSNPSEIQSVRFERKKWTLARAKAWAKKHGFRYGDVYHDSRFIILRQYEQEDGMRYGLKAFSKSKGIYALIRGWGAKKNVANVNEPPSQVNYGEQVTDAQRLDFELGRRNPSEFSAGTESYMRSLPREDRINEIFERSNLEQLKKIGWNLNPNMDDEEMQKQLEFIGGWWNGLSVEKKESVLRNAGLME